MAIELPSGFGRRVNDLDLYIREVQAAVDVSEKARLRRLALVTACDLLRSVDDRNLDHALREILDAPGSQTRTDAKHLLEDRRAFNFFLHRIEDGLFEVAGLAPRTRARVLELLEPLSAEAAASIGSVRYQQLATSYRELCNEVCTLKTQVIDEDNELERSRQASAADTRIVNTLGAVALLVNAATGFAVAASLLFMPAVGMAACAASVAIGGVAQSLKPK